MLLEEENVIETERSSALNYHLYTSAPSSFKLKYFLFLGFAILVDSVFLLSSTGRQEAPAGMFSFVSDGQEAPAGV